MGNQIKFREKLYYGLGDMGCNFIYTTIGSFMTLYYTDVALISAAYIGTMMLVARLFDGVSDLVMGRIIDRTNSKMGKARPWIMWSAAPLCIGLILAFHVPGNFSAGEKQIYAFITYVFLTVICYTAANLAYSTLSSLMSDNPVVRTSLNSFRFFFTFAALYGINAYTNRLVAYYGGGQRGWTRVSVLYAGLAFICLTVTFCGCKEREKRKVNQDGMEHEGSKHASVQSPGVFESLKVLLKNRYFVLVTLLFVVNYILISESNGIGIYYCRDVLGNPALFGTITLAGTVPCMLMMPVLPKLVDRYGKQPCMVIGSVFKVVGFGLAFLCPYNLYVIMTGMILKGIGTGMCSPIFFAIVADIVDYNEYQSGVRIDGFTYSVTSFGMKVGMGVGSALIGFSLAAGHYISGVTVQSASALNYMKINFSLMPAILSIIMVLLAVFIDVEKKLNQCR